MEIELVNALPGLEDNYRGVVKIIINKELMTLEEWNREYKHYRDEYGYSIIHYFEAFIFGLAAFITTNPIMLYGRDELQKRFGVKITTMQEAMKGC